MAEHGSNTGSVNKDKLVVVAIDFGTTFTGYAFSFHHKKRKIFTSTCQGKFPRDRVPTTVLLNPDKTFHSIGFEAEDVYAQLAQHGQHKEWFYFQNFKMTLYQVKQLTRDVTIDDREGRPMSAMYIFSKVIRHLKKCFKEVIRDSIDEIRDEDILWIITVPAIWADSAKQFMREAALKAGIVQNQLQLVLEPEAASLFCKEQPFVKKTYSDQSSEAVKLSEGHTYIIADLGGGTADMCAHQILGSGNLREIYRATGDAIGGTCVDNAFEQFLIKLIGEEAWRTFKEENMDDFLNLMNIFLRKKTMFSTITKEEAVFSFPASLISVIQEKIGQTLEERVTDSDYSDRVSVYKTSRIKLNVKVMEEFFKPTVEGVVKLIKEILTDMETENIQTLLIVGGFSESPYLRETIKSEITGLRIIFPTEGSLAVLKGAVLMGYQPLTIVERKARFSYGYAGMKPFEEGFHPERTKVNFDGKEWSNLVFNKIITKGEVLKTGHVVKFSGFASSKTKASKQDKIITQLYKSTEPDPAYCTEDEGCTPVGFIEQEPPLAGWPDVCSLEIQLTVGETEFTVKLFNKTTEDEYEAKLDFL